MMWVRGAEAAIMIGAGPLSSALMAHLLMHDDKLRRRTMEGIALGMGGIVLISLASRPWDPIGLKEFFGLMLLFSGSIVSAAGNILVAKRKGSLHPVSLNSSQMLLGGIILMLITLLFEDSPPPCLRPSMDNCSGSRLYRPLLSPSGSIC